MEFKTYNDTEIFNIIKEIEKQGWIYHGQFIQDGKKNPLLKLYLFTMLLIYSKVITEYRFENISDYVKPLPKYAIYKHLFTRPLII